MSAAGHGPAAAEALGGDLARRAGGRAEPAWFWCAKAVPAAPSAGRADSPKQREVSEGQTVLRGPDRACLLRAPTSATAPLIPATIDRCTRANAQGRTDRSYPRDPTLLAASVHGSTRFCFRLVASVSVALHETLAADESRASRRASIAPAPAGEASAMIGTRRSHLVQGGRRLKRRLRRSRISPIRRLSERI